MKIVDKFYELIVTIQAMFFFLFFIVNYNNYRNIQYPITITEEISFIVELDLYDLLTGIVLLFVLLIVVGLQVVGSGLNDEGTSNISRLVGFVVLYLILTFGSNYYFAQLQYSLLLNVLFSLAHLLKIMQLFQEKQ